MSETIKCEISAELFLAVATFQSTEEVRYYLNGVCVQNHPESGVILVATDGHVLGTYHDESAEYSGDDRGHIIGLDKAQRQLVKQAIRRAEKLPGDGYSVRLALLDNGNVHPVDENIFAECEVDATFPDWRRVLPCDGTDTRAEKYQGAISFSPALLLTFNTAFPKKPIVLHVGDRSQAVGVRVAGHDSFYGVIMPMRFNADDMCRPYCIDKAVSNPSVEAAA